MIFSFTTENITKRDWNKAKKILKSKEPKENLGDFMAMRIIELIKNNDKEK